MGLDNATIVVATLNMCKQSNTKPNFTAIAEEYGLERHTVAKYWKEGGKFDRPRPKRPSKFDPHLAQIAPLIEQGIYTVKGMFLFLKETVPGFPGTYDGFHSYALSHGYVPRAKREPRPRYETPPGWQLQVDWKEDVRVALADGTVVTRQIFAATLGHSRYHVFVPAASRSGAEFVRCLVAALKEIGGVPKEILTDNMACLVSVRGGRRKKHPWVLQLEKDIGAKIRLCKPRTPQTKGKVESSNRFISSRLAPYSGNVSSLAEVDAAIAAVQRQSNSEPNATTGLPPSALLRKDAEGLAPLPRGMLLDGYLPESSTQTVPQTMLVSFMGRSWSVPASCIGRKATAYLSGDRVVVLVGGEPVAEHPLSERKFNYLESHYMEAMASKGGDIEEMARKSLEILGRSR